MPPAEPLDLNLLREWKEPLTPRRILRDAGGSFIIHALIGIVIWVAPEVEYTETPAIAVDLKHSVTPLYAPRFSEPTQTVPNTGKVTHQLDAANREGSPAPRQYRPPALGSPEPSNQPVTAPTVIEPLKLEAQANQSGQAAVPGLGAGIGGAGIRASAPAPSATAATAPGGTRDPQITAAPPSPTAGKSRPLPEPPGPAVARLNPPAANRGTPMQPGKVAVGDIEVPAVVGNSQAPSQCANDTCSGLQLLSDPQNVDFRPYLQQVLAVVKRNWMTVIPDAAKEGRRGVVVIKFFIQRSGSVSTLSISATSGNGSMDRAAVAGMSMSNPFPPLPAGYKGDEIHLQMAFAYNPTR